MSRDKILGATAIIAVIASIGGGVMAQTGVQDDQRPSGSPAGTAQPALPPELEALKLENIESEIKRGGFREIEGRTGDGIEIEARVDNSGKLIGVEADDGPLPQALIESLLPQSIRDNEVIGQFAVIEEIGSRREMLGVKGEDALGEDMFALFDQDGRLLRFGRDDDDKRPDGKRMHREGRHWGPDHGDGAREKHMRRMAPNPDGNDAGPRRMPALEFEPSEVNKQLSDAGYEKFGFLHIDGPRILLEATNPQGESVTLELDPKGEIIRETAR
ncbi:hypothetical protein [Paracoccus saliphilus]|uniref:Outer membrane lipoprotein LpoB, binds and activates PBP1b n=1 Tax=Paracoccus saliphilus TaxID=405559 RepID=A0AA46A5W7_9RHOB|nr:hypothetical protein [Paracoccus saliphilus]WCR04661.1 hypothetical protein JHX88_08075 [Paracoccus saliphilus]SIS88108.1 Outer membrane lipoprotein LpoB, binds and activates PBP1b [Paracoccus saliphilus]